MSGIEIVYNLEQVPYNKRSIFLAGPTPRDPDVESWRPEAVELLKEMVRDSQGQKGFYTPKSYALVVPEDRDGKWHGRYNAQCEWEHLCIEHANVLAFWIPRSVGGRMPGFTTNVEFGLWLDKKHVVYGRPEGAEKTRYLDWLFLKKLHRTPKPTLREVMWEALSLA